MSEILFGNDIVGWLGVIGDNECPSAPFCSLVQGWSSLVRVKPIFRLWVTWPKLALSNSEEGKKEKRRTPKEKRKTKTDLTFLDTEEVTWLKYVHVLRGWYINTVICTLSFSFDAFQIIPMRTIQRSSYHMYVYLCRKIDFFHRMVIVESKNLVKIPVFEQESFLILSLMIVKYWIHSNRHFNFNFDQVFDAVFHLMSN